jgi:hypothetical protein
VIFPSPLGDVSEGETVSLYRPFWMLQYCARALMQISRSDIISTLDEFLLDGACYLLTGE